MTAVLLAVVMIVIMIPIATMTVNAGSVIESAISWAVSIANDDSHGYSQTSRWGPDYDCSSLVITAFNNAGISTGNATYTGNMISNFQESGFTWIPWSSIGNSSNLQRGDILLNISYHTAIYMGNNQVVEAHARSAADKAYDGRSVSQARTIQGDQDGQEIRVTSYYWYSSGGWDGVLRYNEGPNNFPGDEDTSWNVPVWKNANTDLNTYNDWGTQESGRWIDAGDYCYIEKVYTNGFAHVMYPTPSGDRWAYAYASGFSLEKKQTWHHPEGYFDYVTSDTPGEIKLRGWAFDRDDVNASIELHVYVNDSHYATLVANKPRSDVNNVHGVGDNHGFEDTLYINQSGTLNVKVFAINVGGGDNVLIENGVQSVSVSPITSHKCIKTYTLDGHTYKLYMYPSTWEDSKTWCESKGGYLATITTEREQKALYQAFTETNLSKHKYLNFYLGGKYHNGKWNWVTGEEFSYNAWAPNQPDYAGNAEFYLGTRKEQREISRSFWNDFTNDYYEMMGFVFESGSLEEDIATPSDSLPKANYSIYTNDETWVQNNDIGKAVGTENETRVKAIKLGLENCSGGIKYSGYYSNIGWSDYAQDNAVCGSTDGNASIEAIKMELYGDVANNYNLFYCVHVQNKGWMEWTNNGSPAGTIGANLPITAIKIMLVPQVRYAAHVQDYDWMNRVKDNEICGTIGEKLRIEAIKIYLKDTAYGNIRYSTHVEELGWGQSIYNGKECGTTALGLRTEAFTVELDNKADDLFDVMYKAHIQDVDWMDWVRNGAAAGTTGEKLRMEAFKIMVVPKGYNGAEAFKDYSSIPFVSYSVNSNGAWSDSVINGTVVGKENASRFSAMKIGLSNCSGGIKYAAHFSSSGWGNFVQDNEICSAENGYSSIEAVKMELYGDVASNYNIFYRVHVRDKGWLGWAKNGELSGSTGGSLPITSIQIMLVPQIRYSAHIQDIGWLDQVKDKEICGTTGESLQMEAIKIYLKDTSYGSIRYKTHIEETGWGDYVYNGEQSGTTGQSQRVEAFKVRLDGDANEMFDVMYKAHVQDVDWIDWVRNGDIAGTTGQSLQLEAFKAMVVPKGYTGADSYKEYTAERYTVNFNSMGGECSVDSKAINYCGFYNNLPIPTKVNYVFAGWYDSPEYNNRIISASTHEIKSDITLYAKWDLLADTNLDGKITISDVTAIQRHIAELELFSEEQIILADTNGDGEINIVDATHLQMYLAEYDGIVLGKQTA